MKLLPLSLTEGPLLHLPESFSHCQPGPNWSEGQRHSKMNRAAPLWNSRREHWLHQQIQIATFCFQCSVHQAHSQRKLS